MKTTLRLITLIFLLSLFPVTASAHRSLDKTIGNIEKQSGVEYVAYNERRNPQTKKVYKSSKVIIIPSSHSYLVTELMSSFKSDSKDAVSFTVTQGGMIYTIEFQGGKEQRRYTLVRNDGRGNALLTVEYVNSANAPSRPHGTGRADADDPEFDLELDTFDFDFDVSLILALTVI